MFEFVEVGLGLAGVACDEGGADAYFGQLGAEVVEQLEGALAVDAALHGLEYAAVDVLEGYVDVVADVGVVFHGFDGVEGEGGGVGVVEAYPVGSALGGEQVEEVAQAAAAVAVEAVVGGVLRDEDEFFGSVLHECLRFGEDVFHGSRLVFAAYEGYGAVGAAAVAAFGYFDVGEVFGGGGEPLVGEVGALYAVAGVAEGEDGVDYFVPFVDSVPEVDFGDFLGELVAVAFYEASGGYECALLAVGVVPPVVVFLLYGLLQDGLDGFFLGVADESAGVEDDGVAVVLAAVEVDLYAGAGEVARYVFGVDGVFAAAECDDVYFHVLLPVGFGFGVGRRRWGWLLAGEEAFDEFVGVEYLEVGHFFA